MENLSNIEDETYRTQVLAMLEFHKIFRPFTWPNLRVLRTPSISNHENVLFANNHTLTFHRASN